MECSYWRCRSKRSTKKIILLLITLSVAYTTYAQYPENLSSGQLLHDKLAPTLNSSAKRNAFPAYRVYVKDEISFTKWLQQQLPAVQIISHVGDGHILLISGVNPKRLNQLLGCPWVNFIDVPNRTPKEEREIAYADLTVNKITPLHTRIPWLAGDGMAVSVKEKPFDKEDIDFKGRILDIGTFSEPATVHATTIATLIAGGGNWAPSGKGVAWKSRLATSSFNELMPDDGEQLTEAGISVQNHSYGVGIENYYGIEALAYDKQANAYPELLHVFSSGNEGDQKSATGMYADIAQFANLTGQFKMSKNTLSVGATNQFGEVGIKSSRGPAYDGRIKPEITAFGEGGTSEAAALVSGISLLLQQAFQKDNHTLPPAALVKAAIINSADEAGLPGIDFLSGFGNADALGAVSTILEKRFFTDAISADEKRTFTISIPKDASQCKVTLVWHDPEAAPNAERALVNDLDLELVHTATGEQWQPWVLNHYPHPDSLLLPARRQADHLNNVEQITLSFPGPGNYQLQVAGYDIASGFQEFSLVYEVESGSEWISPTSGSSFQAGKPVMLRWQWNKTSAPGRIEFKAIGSEDWQLVDQMPDLAQSYYMWTPPDTFVQGQLRLLAASSVSLSDTFFISKPVSLQVGYSCEGESMLYWTKVPHVSQYQLYTLGETYLEPFMRTSDTTLLLNGTQAQASYYAVAPVSGSVIAGRSFTINPTSEDIGCYITSFVPRQLVTDTVFLDLAVSTTFGLESITLERWENGVFQTVQTIDQVTDVAMLLADRFPKPGHNLYRVGLKNNKGQFFYSQQEGVYYMRKGDLLVFPNPVFKGQPLHIIEGEEQPLMVRLYDSLGRLLHEVEESGAIKTIQTAPLQKGTYIIQVQSESGSILSKRIVVL